MTNPAIVVMAYNRPAAVARLLHSLATATIAPDTPLIISLDNSPTQPEVRRLVEAFAWPHGPKHIQAWARHLGLVEHYLACGDLTATYGAIVLLEDDLVVARPFQQFARQALARYQVDPTIAGISLNALWFNGYTHYRFTPLLDAGDTFFLQVPWYQGQVLWPEAWQPFRAWLAAGHGAIAPLDPIHPVFQTFAEDEWFPAYTKYLATTGRYFVFPRHSFCTNFGDAGTHFSRATPFFQVPLQQHKNEFVLLEMAASIAIYDSFFELAPTVLKRLAPHLQELDLTLDVHVTKPAHLLQTEWVVTCQPAQQTLYSVTLQQRPIEANLFEVALMQMGAGLAVARQETVRRDRWADWQRTYRLDRYYRRERPAGRLARLLGRFWR